MKTFPMFKSEHETIRNAFINIYEGHVPGFQWTNKKSADTALRDAYNPIIYRINVKVKS